MQSLLRQRIDDHVLPGWVVALYHIEQVHAVWLAGSCAIFLGYRIVPTASSGNQGVGLRRSP